MPRAVAPTRRLLLAGLPAACATGPAPAVLQRGPAAAQVYVVQRDWHTDIGLLSEALSGPLAPFAAHWPGERSLVFGFGERAYLMSRSRSFTDMAMALLPGPGAMLVTGLSVPPDVAFPEGTLALAIDAPGAARLRDYLGGSFERDGTGAPRRLREGPYLGAEYYGATLRYSAAFTCNTWTAEALRQAGLPVRVDGVVLAGQVMAQVRRLAMG